MSYYLGIDVGGTQIKYAVFTKDGDIISSSKISTPKENLELFLEEVYKIIDTSKEDYEIKGIGFSIPGKVDSSLGEIYFGGSLPYLNDLHLKEIMEEKYHCPVNVENDGKSAALGEHSLGNLKEIHNGAVVVLGTGVGSGIILDGRLWRGQHFQAGELSFVINDETPVQLISFYGYRASAVYLIKKLAATMEIDSMDGELIFSKISPDNEAVMKLIREYSRNVAILIFNMQGVLDLKRYLIAGGISSQEIIIKTINEEFDKIRQISPTINETLTRPEILPSKYREKANLIGAVATFLQ